MNKKNEMVFKKQIILIIKKKQKKRSLYFPKKNKLNQKEKNL
jgi:hypothetical protein